MGSEQKTIRGETGRWLRIATLTLTTFLPLLNTFISLLPKKAALVIDEDDVQAARSDLDARIEAELEKRHVQQLQQERRQHKIPQVAATSQEKIQDLVAASQGKLQTVGTAVAESIDDLKSHPYSQKLRKRGEDLTDTLKERTHDLTHSIAERGDELGHAIADRSEEFSHKLRKRSKQVKKTVQKQNRKLQKKWQKQLHQSQQKPNRTFWISLGFGFGLTIAGVITYQFIRRRLQRQSEEGAVIQLTDTTATRADNVTNVASKSNAPYATVSTPASTQSGSSSARSSAAQATNAVPLDAAFVGVTSTKLYYAIETPLEQLPTSHNNPVDVIYFSSEQEASDQGFKPADTHSSAASSHADRSF